ncbi:winged helix-turn-helix domain-containing protein [Acidithiobacillus ferrianus]|uniref:winged helix-turn-helix domain-containing protein n=1 Tax=Acidithiobacillus ferrianus TaxID=2678518 RepID=UPI0034E48A5E
MFWILLNSIGIHGTHLLRLALAGQIRTRSHAATALASVQHRILLVAQPGVSNQEIFVIEDALQRTGARVRWVTERKEARKLHDQWHPQMMIVLGWSGKMGPWIGNLRQSVQCDDLHIVVVSCSPQEQEPREAVEALESGAEAYLPRIFLPDALVAQTQSLLRNIPVNASDRIGDEALVCIDKSAHRVWILGKETHFPGRLFHLLHYLALHQDALISSARIAEVLFPEKSAFIPPNTLVVKIYRLRKLLEQAGAGGWLETVHGYGYRFSPPNPVQNVIETSFR